MEGGGDRRVVGSRWLRPNGCPASGTCEDGPIETATFLCFATASGLAFVAASRLRPARPWQLAALGLGLVLLVAAGEEISWGQRLFDLDTPTVLIDGNRQNELNLHNVDGLQQKAVLAQFGDRLAGLLLPRFVREPWAGRGCRASPATSPTAPAGASPRSSASDPPATTPRPPSSCSPLGSSSSRGRP